MFEPLKVPILVEDLRLAETSWHRSSGIIKDTWWHTFLLGSVLHSTARNLARYVVGLAEMWESNAGSVPQESWNGRILGLVLCNGQES